MSGEKEIKPCPFCGEKVAADIDVDGACRIGCTTFEGCFAHLEDAGWYKTEVAAIEAWNARATPPGFEMVPEGTKALLDAAIRFIDAHPCDPDITKDQSAAWDAYSKLYAAYFTAHRATQNVGADENQLFEDIARINPPAARIFLKQAMDAFPPPGMPITIGTRSEIWGRIVQAYSQLNGFDSDAATPKEAPNAQG